MHEGPSPARGPAEEPGGSPLPGGGNGPQDSSQASRDETPPEMSPEMSAEGSAQGLFLCLPAGPADLSGFTSGTQTVPVAPGPLLAGLAEAVAGGDGAALAGVPEDALYAVIGAGRRMSSWATWLELAAMRELAVRHPEPRPAAQKQPAPKDQPAAQDRPAAQNPSDDGRVRFSEFIADEVALELRMTWNAATSRMTYACDLAGRLPVTFAALGAGLIDPVHAKIIYELTDILSAADAAKADPVLAAAAQHKTYGELRAHAARLVLKLDPDSAERRKQALRKREAHVRPFREESGNAGIIARELPSDQVLASWQHVEQRAPDLRAAGIPGSLRELRMMACLDLLQERDSRLAAGSAPDQEGPGTGDGDAGNGGPQDGPGGPEGGPGGTGPGPGSPAGTGPDGRARSTGTDSGPVLAALVNITVPLATLLAPPPPTAAPSASTPPRPAQNHQAPNHRAQNHQAQNHQAQNHRFSYPRAPRTWALPVTPRSGPDQQPPPDTRAQDYLRGLQVRLAPIARGSCDHRHAETGYQPSRKLRHLVRARSTTCAAPGCSRPAARCDLDHTVAWDKGGLTCECGLAPPCKR